MVRGVRVRGEAKTHALVPSRVGERNLRAKGLEGLSLLLGSSGSSSSGLGLDDLLLGNSCGDGHSGGLGLGV